MRSSTPAYAAGVGRRWSRIGGIVAAAAIGLALAGGGAAGSGAGGASAFTGYAFDACNAPGQAALAAWLASPYRAIGIYIGGVNRACANGQLSPAWTAGATAAGWSLIPLYVGLQAPCVGQGGVSKISPALAASQGLSLIHI